MIPITWILYIPHGVDRVSQYSMIILSSAIAIVLLYLKMRTSPSMTNSCDNVYDGFGFIRIYSGFRLLNAGSKHDFFPFGENSSLTDACKI